MENVRHRPGAFKQQNKAHKTGRHRSKGQIDNTNKGKVEVKALTKHRKQQSRDDRKNRLNQLRKTKREEILNKKRLIGGLNGAPHIVVLENISNSNSASLFTFQLLFYFQVHFASFKRCELHWDRWSTHQMRSTSKKSNYRDWILYARVIQITNRLIYFLFDRFFLLSSDLLVSRWNATFWFPIPWTQTQ